MKLWGWFTLYWVRLCWLLMGVMIGIEIGHHGWYVGLFGPICVGLILMILGTLETDSKYRRTDGR